MSDKICTVTVKMNDKLCMEKERQIAEELVWLAAQAAIEKSVNNAPIDTGTLRRSGVVTMGKLPDPKEVFWGAQWDSFNGSEYSESKKGRNADGAVAYASYNTPYALKLHEDTKWTPRNGGGPKWLEKAIPAVIARWNVFVQRARRKAGL